MNTINRRNFLSVAALAAPAIATGQFTDKKREFKQEPIKTAINFMYDSYMYTPAEMIRVLQEISTEKEIIPDEYADGGIVQELEQKMIALTGKEAAIYMPSGTMANNLAIRILSNDMPIVFGAANSHLANREADSAEVLHQKKLVLLGPGKPYFSPEELFGAFEEHKKNSKYGNDIGAISFEIATRLAFNRTQPLDQLQFIAAFARKNNIPLHMDGARIHSATAYTGVSIKEYCALFDTVYMDLYKYFRASYGAVLCGSKEIIGKMKRYIKMCGGNLPYNWMTAAVALHYMDGFAQRFLQAKENGAAIINGINKIEGLRITSFEDGTNVFLLHFTKGDPQKIAAWLAGKHRILLRMDDYDAVGKFIPFKINETQLQVSPRKITDAFAEAAKIS